MASYILRRLVWTIPVLLVTVFLTLVLVRALPGEPFSNPRLAETTRETLRERYGYNDTLGEQYVKVVRALPTLDFGQSSHVVSRTAVQLIRGLIPNTLILGAAAFSLALMLGTVAGVISALYSGRMLDWALLIGTTIFFAIPTFVTSVYWIAYLPYGWSEGWGGRIGPVTVLSLSIMPYFTRLLRASMIESLQLDHVLVARSKGLPWRRVVVRHVVRNSLIPMVTNAGPLLAFVLTGSFIVEEIFNVPGIASLFVSSFESKGNGGPDTAVILALTIMLATFVVVANLIVDVIVATLDRRITHA